jgi:tetratricopeptide (TPR) repeat protein
MDTTAVVRMLDHYLHTARHAALLLTPLRSDIQLAEPQPGTVVTDLPDRAAALAWFTTEHRCLATATQYALDYGYPAHCWQLAWALVDFFNRQGHRDEQAHVQQLALAAANQSDDLEGQAHALRGLARASARLRAFDDAYAYLAAALTAREKLGDPHNQAVIHLEFTVTMLLEGRPADAHKHAELALPLDVACGHQHGQSKALSAMGYCQALLGNYQDALGYCHRSLQLHEDSVSLTSKADTLDTIGYCHHNLGDHGQAVEYYRQCLQMGREVDDLMTQGTALARIGDVHWDAGERVAARQAWQEALAVLGDVNPPDSEQLRAKLARQD